MIKQNLHTHTCLDHGWDTVDEMIGTALEKGFTHLGFSGHSYNRPLAPTSMSLENSEIYRQQVLKAKDDYKDQIQIFCGIEQDSMNRIDCSEFDYVIGSVHWLEHNGQIWPIDASMEDFVWMLQDGFDGDMEALVRYYYQKVEEMMDWQAVDIVGHLDLIYTYNEWRDFFPFDADWYLKPAFKAIDKGIANGKIFEMNTGAIARGDRISPYPHPILLSYMADHGAKLCINTDCHDRRYLDLCISECIELAKISGFKELYVLTDQGFVPTPIDEFDVRPAHPIQHS